MGCEVNQQAFVQAAQSYINRANDAAAASTASKDMRPSLQQGGMPEIILPNLASIGIAGNVDQFRYESSGQALYFCKSGSAPGAEFSVEISGGKTYTKIVPGTKIVAPFDGFNLTNTGVRAGIARFVIMQRDDVDYNEENIESAFVQTQAALSGTTGGATALYNAAAFGTNAPSGLGPAAVTNGSAVRLNGANAVRCFYRAGSGGNFLTGFIRWWLIEDVGPTGLYPLSITIPATSWCPSPNVENLLTGFSRGVTSDFQIGVKSGYAYPEFVGVTTDVGSGNINFSIEVL